MLNGLEFIGIDYIFEFQTGIMIARVGYFSIKTT